MNPVHGVLFLFQDLNFYQPYDFGARYERNSWISGVTKIISVTAFCLFICISIKKQKCTFPSGSGFGRI